MTSTDSEINHRALGIALFNQTWDLMELPERSVEQDDAMLHMAHASAHHWRSEGSGATANNLARSEWQVSRVYTVLGRAEPAGYHARRCLEICQDNGIGDWDLGYAYEALARAAVVAGDLGTARRWAGKAHAQLDQIAKEGERKHLREDLATLPQPTTD